MSRPTAQDPGATVLRSVQIALFSAVAVALGFLLMGTPVELVTLTICLAGVIRGPRAGLAVGLIVQLIYRGFHPFGSSFALPLLFLFQLLDGALAGLVGGTLRSILLRGGLGARLLSALAGLLLTLASQAGASLSFALQSGGMDTFLGWLIAGSVFTLSYIVWNTAVFSLLPDLLRELGRRNPRLFEKSDSR